MNYIIPILLIIVLIDLIIANQCIDTIGWHDNINNSTCSDYVTNGWCVSNTLTSTMQVSSIPLLNFPDLNCCACGKKASLTLSSTTQWAQFATTVAGAANGTSGSSLNLLYYPYGITIADDNTLYICDTYNDRVFLVQPSSTTATAVIGQGSAPASTLWGPTDIFVTQTAIYVLDTWDFRVQKWSRNLSNPVTVAGVLGVNGGSADMTTFSYSYDLFVDNYANIFVSDYTNHRVMMFPWNSTNGTAGLMVAGTGINGSDVNQLNGPLGLYVDDNAILYIADYYNHRIQKWIVGAPSGVNAAGTGVDGSDLSQISLPTAILVDSSGYMYILEEANARVTRWAPGANVGECIAGCSGIEGVAADQLYAPFSIAFDSSGSLYVGDTYNNRVQKFQILSRSSTQSTTTLQSVTAQSALPITNQDATSMTTMMVTQTTLSTTISGSTAQLTTSIPTQTMNSTSTTYSKATLIKPQFFILLIILYIQIVFEYKI